MHPARLVGSAGVHPARLVVVGWGVSARAVAAVSALLPLSITAVFLLPLFVSSSRVVAAGAGCAGGVFFLRGVCCSFGVCRSGLPRYFNVI